MDRYAEINRRLAEGRGVREISRALGCSRRLVRERRQDFPRAGRWPARVRLRKIGLLPNADNLVGNLALARSSGTYLRYRDKLSRPDLVIIDDFGLRKLSATEAQDLCELLEERSIGKSTLFTTQLPLGSLERSNP